MRSHAPFSPPPPKPSKARLYLGVLLGIVLLGGIGSFLTRGEKAPTPKKSKEYVTITLPPPPPPPPPPPKVEPPKPPEEQPKEEEMIEQEPVPDDEPPPEEVPQEAPPENLSTGIAGNGPDMGLSRGNGNGNQGKIGGGGRKGGGSKFGWYAAKVQTSIADALRKHPSTRSAKMVLQIRVWPDANGRITRAQLVGSSGNADVDSAIKNQILTGLQLPQAPPADMPVPIVLRITANRAEL